MSDIEISRASSIGRDVSLQRYQDSNDFGVRIKTLTRLNPWMAERPDVVTALAASPLPTGQLMQQGAALYGMQASDTMRLQLEKMTETQQRAVFSSLTYAQQMALNSQGYKAPERDEERIYEQILNPIGDVIGTVMKPIGWVGKQLHVGDVFDGMIWLGDQPARLYRTIRTMDDDAQLLGAIGAVIGGVAAIAAAPFTGGGSLAVLGTLGAGALAGGTLGAIAATSPTDWYQAWSAAENGEQTFDRPSQAKVERLLGDPRLINLAGDIARELPPEFNLVDLAKDMAGDRDVSIESQMARLGGVVEQFATPGTVQYRQIAYGISQIIQNPLFQEAVAALQRGKISMGRDLADGLQLDPTSGWYNLVSGSVDAVATIALDPLLIAGKVFRGAQYMARGLNLADINHVDRFFKIYRSSAAVRRQHQAIAEAVNLGDSAMMKRLAPTMKEQWGELLKYRQELSLTSGNPDRLFTVEDFHEWIVGMNKLAPLMKGFGTVRGFNNGVILSGITRRNQAWQQIAGRMRSFTDGLTDPKFEKKLLQLLEETPEQALRLFPEEVVPDVGRASLNGRLNKVRRDYFNAKEKLDNLPATRVQELQQRAAATGADWRELEIPGFVQLQQDAQLFQRMGTLNTGVIDRNLMKEWALVNDEFPMFRTIGRELADKVPPLGFFGRTAKKIVTMAPKGKVIHLNGLDAADDIRLFTELGALTGLPEWLRRSWADAIMYQASTGVRQTAVMSYFDNMLTISGVRALPEGEQMANEMLARVKQAYGAGSSDNAIANGIATRQGIFLDDMADAITMPDLTELRKVVKAGYMAKVVGLADLPVIEQFQARVWKPSVLLRIGFIPRAAGEEFLNYLLRGGFGSVGQELGARAIARPRAIEQIQRQMLSARANQMPFLSNAAEELVRQGAMPLGMRTIYRKLSHYDFADPITHSIERWADFYRNILENGLFGRAGEDIANRALTNLAGHERRLYELSDQAGRLQIVQGKLNATQRMRSNFATSIDSLVLGSPLSWRRMSVGGVNDDLIEAGMRWYEHHGTTVMREIGSTSAGPYDASRPQHDTYRQVINDAVTGKPVEVEYAVLRGTRQLYARGANADGYFKSAFLHQATRPVDDELVNTVVSPLVARIKPQGLDESTIITVRELFDDWQRSAHWVAKEIVAEFRHTPRYDRVSELLDRLSTHVGKGRIRSNVLEPLQAGLTEVNLSLERITDILSTRVGTQAARIKTIDGAIANDIQRYFQQIVPAVDALTPPQAAWMNQFLSRFEWEGITARGHALFNNWDEAAVAITNELDAVLATPEYAGRLGHFQGLTNTQRGTELNKLGEVTAYSDNLEPFYRPNIPAGASDQVTLQTILDNALDKQLIQDNAFTVSTWIDTLTSTNKVGLLTSRRLSDEITNALHRIPALNYTADIPPSTIVDLPRNARIAKLPGVQRLDEIEAKAIELQYGMSPYTAPNVLPAPERGVYTMQTDLYNDRSVGVWRNPDRVVDEERRALADRMVEFVRFHWTRNNQEVLIPRMRTLDNGNVESLVYRMDGEHLVPLAPTDEITQYDQFVDHEGRAIQWGDRTYFDARTIGGDNEIMWEMIGPVLQDGLDNMIRRPMIGTKMPRVAPGTELVAAPNARLYRSRITDVDKVGDVAPNAIHGEVIQALKRNKWDDFVRYGFDKVIGPSIDALARRPMAFHFFAQRYAQNKGLRTWLVNKKLMTDVEDIAVSLAAASGLAADEITQIADYGRTVGMFIDDVRRTNRWSDGEALAWLRGHSATDLADRINKARIRFDIDKNLGKFTRQEAAALDVAISQLARRDPADLVKVLPVDMPAADLLTYVRAILPPNFLTTMSDPVIAARNLPVVRNHPLLSRLASDDWETIVRANNNLEAVSREAGEFAAVAAINDMLPFIDSHTFKTQFAEYGKGFLPFWYAEENFMKRWARTLINQPFDTLRKAQLGYMGIKHAGVIRKDSNGKDWFVYPGSNLLQEAINKIPGLPDLPVGVMFQTPTDMMLPGINSRFGEPQFGPLVSIPLNFAQGLMPELTTFNRRVLGDLGASRGIIRQLIPATLVNTYDALISDEESSTRYASAMAAAIANLEANGMGIPDNATAGQVDEFLDKVRNHARIIVMAQALGGWFAPGPLTQLNTGTDAPVLGLNVDDPSTLLSNMYVDLVREMGIEQGTLAYLAAVPLTDVGELVNPLAYTQARNQSTSGAPLPATEIALTFFDNNSDYMAEFPFAGPWLLPADPDNKEPHSQYAYDQQTINGLRRRNAPDELLRRIKFRQASTEYFSKRDIYLTAVDEARGRNDRAKVTKLNRLWDEWSLSYRAAHPLFAEELESSDARERRKRTLAEMRIVLGDPDAPQSPQLEGLRTMMQTYDLFLTRKGEFAEDTTARGRLKVEKLKGRFESFMDDLVVQYPELQSFWLGVLRPESALD